MNIISAYIFEGTYCFNTDACFVLKGSWKPVFNIGTVLSAIQLLLAEPNPDDPLMADVVSLHSDLVCLKSHSCTFFLVWSDAYWIRNLKITTNCVTQSYFVHG